LRRPRHWPGPAVGGGPGRAALRRRHGRPGLGAHANFAILYVFLALGLNIVVGFAGLLDLGYVAFYAVGAYAYALLASPHFGLHCRSG
jgi:ABC-type branched-subunit amino acid transport system permease subunit